MLEQKGQASFELAILAVVVLIISTAVIGKYLLVHNDTTALIVAKQSIAEKLSKQPIPYAIQTIEWEKCGTELRLNVNTIPSGLTSLDAADVLAVQSEVADSTSFQTVLITLNDVEPTC